MGTWVLLKVNKSVEESGKLVHRHKGDWVEVGKQTAMRWKSQGDCEIPGSDTLDGYAGLEHAGIMVTGNDDTARTLLEKHTDKLNIEYGEPALLWSKTIIWKPPVSMPWRLVPIALGLLNTWQILAPLCDYRIRAHDIGTDAEKARTKAVIRDLRVKVYETGLIFIRRSSDTERFMDRWRQEFDGGSNRNLAFLRALYKEKPFILALPRTWAMRQ